MPSQTYLDNIKTHVDDMLGASAVVSGSGVALQGIAEVTAVKVMISQIIMTPPVDSERGGGRQLLHNTQAYLTLIFSKGAYLACYMRQITCEGHTESFKYAKQMHESAQAAP